MKHCMWKLIIGSQGQFVFTVLRFLKVGCIGFYLKEPYLCWSGLYQLAGSQVWWISSARGFFPHSPRFNDQSHSATGKIFQGAPRPLVHRVLWHQCRRWPLQLTWNRFNPMADQILILYHQYTDSSIYTLPEIVMEVENHLFMEENSHPRYPNCHAIHFNDDSRECSVKYL